MSEYTERIEEFHQKGWADSESHKLIDEIHDSHKELVSVMGELVKHISAHKNHDTRISELLLFCQTTWPDYFGEKEQ